MGKGVRLRGRTGLMQLAVAVGYILAYTAIRPHSDAHWALTSGLRLACLLLVPYRYWAALAIGEAVPLVYSLMPCLPQFGPFTVAIWSFPPIVTAMPWVWACRRYLRLFPTQRVVDMKALLLCVLSVSLIWTGVTYAGLCVEIEPQRTLDHISSVMVAGLFIGNYVAVLTVVTWPLLLKIGYEGKPWRTALADAANSRLTVDTVFIALPLLLVIAVISAWTAAPFSSMLQMALFLPVAWLAIKYGWRGAAACGPLAVACVCVLTESVPDTAIIQAQGFVAFAVTCLFIMGARIASQLHRSERERQAVTNALRVAQQCIYQADLRLRSTSQTLEVVGGSVSVVQSRIVDRVKMFLPDMDRQTLMRQASMTQSHLYRLAETLHPTAWRDRGFPAALRETIGRALDEVGVAYACEIQGRGLSQLPLAVHQAIYRLATESIAHISTMRRCERIRVVLRGGLRADGDRWALLRITGIGDALMFRTPLPPNGRPNVGLSLGTQGLDVQDLKDQVALYGGTLHTKDESGSFTLTMLLHDPSRLSARQARAEQDVWLWVH